MIIDQKQYSVNKNMKIIVVDIDEKRYDGLRDILAENYTIYDATDEQDAVSYLDYNLQSVIAVLFNAENILDNSFGLIDNISGNTRFVMIPLIAVCDRSDDEIRGMCINSGINEYFQPPFVRDIIMLRLNNAVKAKDAVTFHEMEMMLHELPANIYLKDSSGRYVFSSHYWHHLKAQEPGWTIRGKTEYDIQKDPEIAKKVALADIEMLKTRKGTSYILDLNTDGIQEYIHVIKSPTYDSNGNVSGIIAIMTDVTELELLKRKLENRSEQIDAELKVAAQIQHNMLPRQSADYGGLSIFASMTPAKNVGGDFYDFFFIDTNHMGFIMADVSGKGVPASLFMTISKIVIHDRALAGGTPAEVLTDANHRINENNMMGLFVTAWLGILNTETGIMTFANAGHEYPAMLTKDKTFTLVETDNLPPVATVDDMKYEDHTIDMSNGATLFLYTDGVTEAKNSRSERFGMDRMLDVLNSDPDRSPKDIIDCMKKDIDDFAGNTEQFDDITMMCIKYRGIH